VRVNKAKFPDFQEHAGHFYRIHAIISAVFQLISVDRASVTLPMAKSGVIENGLMASDTFWWRYAIEYFCDLR